MAKEYGNITVVLEHYEVTISGWQEGRLRAETSLITQVYLVTWLGCSKLICGDAEALVKIWL
jgi:hypothetical protein